MPSPQLRLPSPQLRAVWHTAVHQQTHLSGSDAEKLEASASCRAVIEKSVVSENWIENLEIPLIL